MSLATAALLVDPCRVCLSDRSLIWRCCETHATARAEAAESLDEARHTISDAQTDPA